MLELPREDCLVQFPAPTAPVSACGQLHQLLRDGGCAGNKMTRPQIACARGGQGMPVDAVMFVKPPIFQGNSDARQPQSHTLERNWKLRPRFGRRELSNFPTTAIQERQCSGGRFLQLGRNWNRPNDRSQHRQDDHRPD